MSLLDEMSDLGAPPGPVTFASAMLACDRAKQWQQVLRIMDQVRRAVYAAVGRQRGEGLGRLVKA